MRNNSNTTLHILRLLMVTLVVTLGLMASGCGDEDDGTSDVVVTDAGNIDNADVEPDTAMPDSDMVEPDTAVENQPPTVMLLSPTDGTMVRVGVDVEFEAQVSDDRDAPDSLTVSLSSDRDGAIAVEGPDATGRVTATSATLSEGVHTISATVTDTEGASISGTVLLTVTGNVPPSITFVAPEPDTTFPTGSPQAVRI
ncbi:MAG: Ig-like domain-containing protein, partial [Myxococcota bacterium]